MKCTLKIFILVTIMIILNNCGMMLPRWKSIQLTDLEMNTVQQLQVDLKDVQKLKGKPLYKFSEKELSIYLGYLQFAEPDLRSRVQHLARKCLNQPYQIYLLGEFPIEIYDPEPLYNLKKSDCVVFSEQIYAMALAYDWKSFFTLLQRIRYKNGEISFFTRNHYTEYDWDINNNWLVQDMTEMLAGNGINKTVSYIDKAAFFKGRGISRDVPIDSIEWSYIPYQLVPQIIDLLKPGDFVNIVRGNDSSKYIGHVGLITKSPDGTVNFLHSTNPKVKEEPLLKYITDCVIRNDERREENLKRIAYNEKLKSKNSKKPFMMPLPYFYGFKFLRLQEDPLWELVKIDGLDAPKLSIPSGY